MRWRKSQFPVDTAVRCARASALCWSDQMLGSGASSRSTPPARGLLDPRRQPPAASRPSGSDNGRGGRARRQSPTLHCPPERSGMSAARIETPSSKSCESVCARRVMRSSRAATKTAPSCLHRTSAAWKPGRRSSLPEGTSEYSATSVQPRLAAKVRTEACCASHLPHSDATDGPETDAETE